MKNMTKKTSFRRSALTAGFGALVISSSTWGHHSYAMFDRENTADYDAIVRIWEFTNPHSYLWVYINDASGAPQLWGLEAPSPAGLERAGWSKNTVSPGDKIKVVINPLRDGRNGGNLVSLVDREGRTMDVGPVPGAPGRSVLNNGPRPP